MSLAADRDPVRQILRPGSLRESLIIIYREVSFTFVIEGITLFIEGITLFPPFSTGNCRSVSQQAQVPILRPCISSSSPHARPHNNRVGLHVGMSAAGTATRPLSVTVCTSTATAKHPCDPAPMQASTGAGTCWRHNPKGMGTLEKLPACGQRWDVPTHAHEQRISYVCRRHISRRDDLMLSRVQLMFHTH